MPCCDRLSTLPEGAIKSPWGRLPHQAGPHQSARMGVSGGRAHPSVGPFSGHHSCGVASTPRNLRRKDRGHLGPESGRSLPRNLGQGCGRCRGVYGHGLGRHSMQSAADSSDCRLSGDRDLSRTCRAFCVSSACQRFTSLNQNALSLASRATVAMRRHSSACRRKCSTLTCFLPTDRFRVGELKSYSAIFWESMA